ncbi:glycosyltransferase family 2 protein [Candidatus Uhrbacteria bacterium]|nr:glycosyltransferase family 2 protein [Candidatus Uhrbacteria bacterium]
MQKDKISVIMPVYNAADTVSETLDSLLVQTYGNFEVLAVDDGSTDSSRDIIRKYAAEDGRIRLIERETNGGVAAAINTGLGLADGEFIARIDADDLARPYRFQKQVDFFRQHPEVGILGGGYAPFREDGTGFEAFHPTDCLELAWRFVTNTYFCHPSVMFRRGVFEAMGDYPKVEAEDFAYFSEAIKLFRGANLPEILIDYRESPQNRSNSAADRIAKSVRVQARRNYEYYLGPKDGNFELFFAYQHDRRLTWRDWIKIEKINCTILNKLVKQCKISRCSKSFLTLRMRIVFEGFQKILR